MPKVIAVGSAHDGTVRIWYTDSGKELFKLKIAILNGFVLISPDGKIIATAAWDGTVRIWDVDSGKELQTLREHDGDGYAMLSADLSPDGKTIVTTSNTGNGVVRIWDVDSGKRLQVLEGHQRGLFSATFSPDGKKIAVTSGDHHHGNVIVTRIWILE